jgi:hypothetical protein
MNSAEGILEYLLKPFFIGLYIGIAGCIFFFIQGKVKLRKQRKENRRLKQHIQMKLEIEAEETERKKREIESLKEECENLRVTVQEYVKKPGRKELRQLHIYQAAIEILTEKAPGFAQSWLSAVREGEEELKKSERGVIPFVRKLLPGNSSRTKVIDDGSDSMHSS